MADSLYRKYRPVSLDDYSSDKIKMRVRGLMQGGVENLPHFWIIAGTHGCGKTTLARIMARVLMCTNPVNGDACGECPTCKAMEDFILTGDPVPGVEEVNVASEGGKASLISTITKASEPSFLSQRTILILDEVQNASVQGQQALLKPLEDIPDHLFVLMATTEINKILPTIQSRAGVTIRVTAHPVPEVVGRLDKVCKAEGIKATKGALRLIARHEGGIFRDSFNRLEQAAAAVHGGTIREEDVLGLYDIVPVDMYLNFLNACEKGDLSEAYLIIRRIVGSGVDPAAYILGMLGEITEAVDSCYSGGASGGLVDWVKSHDDGLIFRIMRLLGNHSVHPTSTVGGVRVSVDSEFFYLAACMVEVFNGK